VAASSEVAAAGEMAGRSVYADYIREQLEAQEARKVSLEQRGTAVISTSGLLVTALFGLVTVSKQVKTTLEITMGARVLFVLAVAIFVVAAVSGILANLPLQYRGPTVKAMREAVRARWDDTLAVAERKVALTRLESLEAAKGKNNFKSTVVTIGIAFEFVAIAVLSSAVALVLWSL
jgi:hypothetical protein